MYTEQSGECRLYPDLMLDIETLATSNNAVVTQIGVCAFDIESGNYDTDLGDSGLCINLQIQDQLDRGRVITQRTLFWWLEQILQTNKCTWMKYLYGPVSAIQLLQKYTSTHCAKNFNVWSHTFDTNIMSDLSSMYNHKLPWTYRQQRDIRTLTCLAGYKKKQQVEGFDKTHNALDDCLYQIGYCCDAWRQIHVDNKGKIS